MLDDPPQELQAASNPGLIIALRSGEIPGFSQCGQRNIAINPQTDRLRLAIPTSPSRPEPKSHTAGGIGTTEKSAIHASVCPLGFKPDPVMIDPSADILRALYKLHPDKSNPSATNIDRMLRVPFTSSQIHSPSLAVEKTDPTSMLPSADMPFANDSMDSMFRYWNPSEAVQRKMSLCCASPPITLASVDATVGRSKTLPNKSTQLPSAAQYPDVLPIGLIPSTAVPSGEIPVAEVSGLLGGIADVFNPTMPVGAVHL